MERYAGGDDSAFAELYDELAPRLRALALRVVRDRVLAEDVVQQTFLNLHRARGAFVSGAAVLPWASAIARRVATDQLRGRTSVNRLEGALRRVLQAEGVRPDDEIVALQTAESLGLAIAALPKQQRRAFQLRGRGLSIAEVATRVGSTIPAVKLRLHRAVRALRAVLAAGAGEPQP
jgi:RNA polymerase sigma-70 factor (ECF subfamily)